jgi:hypothetical protein
VFPINCGYTIQAKQKCQINLGDFQSAKVIITFSPKVQILWEVLDNIGHKIWTLGDKAIITLAD